MLGRGSPVEITGLIEDQRVRERTVERAVVRALERSERKADTILIAV